MAKKVILVTGANAGVGFECCKALAAYENVHILMTGRNEERLHAAAEKVRANASSTAEIEEDILDLASLANVATFCDSVKVRGLHFYTVVCNGGLQTFTKQPTVDGFEQTFGVNHLAHFMLITRLKDHIDRFMTLGSETHDPREGTGLPMPNLSNLDELAKGYEDFNGLEAYTTSKLCNISFTLAFVRAYPHGPQSISYSPGYTPDTSLYRSFGEKQDEMVDATTKKLQEKGFPISSAEYSGGIMAQLAYDKWDGQKWTNGTYISIDQVKETSSQASDPVLANAIWEKCEELTAKF